MAIEQLDAIHVGDRVTVVENLRQREDKSFQGDCLEVLAVDSPFLVTRTRGLCHPLVLDARRWTLKKFSTEAVQALESVRQPTDESPRPTNAVAGTMESPQADTSRH